MVVIEPERTNDDIRVEHQCQVFSGCRVVVVAWFTQIATAMRYLIRAADHSAADAKAGISRIEISIGGIGILRSRNAKRKAGPIDGQRGPSAFAMRPAGLGH